MEEKTYEEMQEYVLNALVKHGIEALGDIAKCGHLVDLGLRVTEHEPISEMEDIYYYIKYAEIILKREQHPSTLIVYTVSQDLVGALSDNPPKHRTYNYKELFDKAILIKASMG